MRKRSSSARLVSDRSYKYVRGVLSKLTKIQTCCFLMLTQTCKSFSLFWASKDKTGKKTLLAAKTIATVLLFISIRFLRRISSSLFDFYAASIIFHLHLYRHSSICSNMAIMRLTIFVFTFF